MRSELLLPLLGVVFLGCQIVLGFEDHELAPGGAVGGGGGEPIACEQPSDCGQDLPCAVRTCEGDPKLCGVSAKPDGGACDDGAGQVEGRCQAGQCLDCVDAFDCDQGSICLPTNVCCTPLTQAEACAGRDCGTVSDGCTAEHDCGSCSGPTPACDQSVGACVECTDDSFCETASAGHLCKLDSMTCGCAGNSDCGDTTDGARCKSPGQVCGCNNGNDCNGNVNGPNCVGDVCVP